ncbi:hypothetical protein L6164_027038 [Bauhinia variegata]|uniref:Uncharacterized protein n=1 Tax=Bauhinia variegata TaxID=167791 RepID=A0ACB9LRY4_BAUVA|nr:hypothetical protein L6164_027038 [Bauhinia variegata]
MEGMMKQMRVKFVGPEQESRDQKIPAQKTQPFKEKKPQNWFQRQFQRKTNQDYDSSEIEHAVAVAAATFAVNSQEVSEIPQKKKDREALWTSLTRTKSKRDSSKSPISQTSGAIRISSGNNIPITTPTDEKTITPAPSTKKTETFREHLKNTEDRKPETAATPAPKHPPPVEPGISRPPPPPPPPPPTKTKQTPTRPAAGETIADVWEREELDTIKERYEKVHETINTWENKKKTKAKRKLDKQEGELDRKRVKALQKFKEEIQYLDKITGGARKQAKDRQRTEELKAAEKANAIRKSGKVPATCYCF